MIFSCDAITKTGKAHTKCDDSSLSFKDESYAWAIISDGCSSSQDSDIGSRLLVNICNIVIEKMKTNFNSFSDQIYTESIKNLCREHVDFLAKYGISNTLFDATLGIIYANNITRNFEVSLIGDGTILAIKKDGSYEWKQISFRDGAPYYLSYKLDEQRDERLKETYDMTRIIVNSDKRDEFFTDINYTMSFPMNKYHTVLLATDGIDTFHEMAKPEDGGGLLTLDSDLVRKEMTNFKSFNGNFIQRRVSRFLQDGFIQRRNHLDDFSLAGIHMNEELPL